MITRVLTVSPNPAKGKDSLLISTYNRIISNTIEQSVIFFGFYTTLLYHNSDNFRSLGRDKVLVFAGLFIIGRIAFTVGYFLVLITRIQTCRSFGFAINVMTNTLLASILFNYNLIGKFVSLMHPLTSMIS